MKALIHVNRNAEFQDPINTINWAVLLEQLDETQTARVQYLKPVCLNGNPVHEDRKAKVVQMLLNVVHAGLDPADLELDCTDPQCYCDDAAIAAIFPPAE